MKKLINDQFLLQSDEASRLYHEYASDLPIIDFHCHLSPDEIVANRTWENISQIWLDGDHYKWRAMRSNGIDERFCTGNATDREKFDAFAATMPYLLRNPLYHWSHLELARYFGIDDLVLSPETADEVWERTHEVFQQGLTVKDLMQVSKVELVCTTDDPADSLEQHVQVAASDDYDVTLLPAWRPDEVLAITNVTQFNSYLDRLGEVAGVQINDYDDLLTALNNRHDYFHSQGCRLSDHGIDVFSFSPCSESEIKSIFATARMGGEVSAENTSKFVTAMMLELARMDAAKSWTKQLHIGAMRDNNSRMSGIFGYDSIGDHSYAQPLASYLNALDNEGKLPKTILYNLNPSDNEMLATMIGNFQDGKTPGKIQLGSGWWFQDQKDGMERQLEALSQMGLLRRFVGMVTDSRSFLSYTRHEYFRRVLCNVLGNDMAQGLVPYDFDLVGATIADISYHNATSYFGFKKQRRWGQ